MPPAGSRRPVARRGAALAALALVLAMIPLGPARPARAGLGSDANDMCPVTTGLPAVARNTFDFTGTLSCYRPGASKFAGTPPPTNYVRSESPAPGDHCYNIYYYAVTFYESNQGAVRADFHFNHNTGHENTSLSADQALRSLTSDAWSTDAQAGTYQPSNPSDPTSPLTCNLDPTYRSYCVDSGIDQSCFDWVQHSITPANAPRPTTLAPYLGRVSDTLHQVAGTIKSAPSGKGVVNAPVCFWIDGLNDGAEKDLELIVPVADGSGRQIFYTYLIRITLQSLRWDFGDIHDPSNREVPADPACQQPGRPQLTAHAYTEISDDVNPDLKYHVTAHEQYGITADLFWVDSTGSHGPETVPASTIDTTIPDVPTDEYGQYVGQVEGIPIGDPAGG